MLQGGSPAPVLTKGKLSSGIWDERDCQAGAQFWCCGPPISPDPQHLHSSGGPSFGDGNWICGPGPCCVWSDVWPNDQYTSMSTGKSPANATKN